MWLIFLVANFLALLLFYWPALKIGFSNVDDLSLLGIPQFELPFLPFLKLLFDPTLNLDFYPARDFFYYMELHLFGMEPLGFRVASIFYLAISGTLLGRVLILLGAHRTWGYIIALLWAIHPYHLETVLWISARKDLLAILFFLASLLCMLETIERKKIWGLTLSGFFFWTCCLAKASFVLLPFALPLYQWSVSYEKRLPFAYCFCLMASSLFFVALQSWFYSQVNNMKVQVEWLERLPIVVASFGKMFIGIFDPIVNEMEFDQWGEWFSRNQVFFYFGVAILLAASLLSVRLLLAKRSALLLLMAVIAFGVLPIPNLVIAHRAFYSTRYFEPVFLFLVLIAAIGNGVSFLKKYPTHVAFGVGALFFIFQQQCLKPWLDPIAYGSEKLSTDPHNILAQTGLFLELVNQKDPESLSLRTRLAQSLTNDCNSFDPQALSAQSPILSCRFFYLHAFQIRYYQKNFPAARIYIEKLSRIQFGNVLPNRLFARTRLQLALAEGISFAQEAQDYLALAKYNPDEISRILTVASLCLLDRRSEGAQRARDWISLKLIRKASWNDFLDSGLSSSFHDSIVSCVENPG